MHNLYKCTLFSSPNLGLNTNCTPSILYTCNDLSKRSYDIILHKCTHVTCTESEISKFSEFTSEISEVYNDTQYTQYAQFNKHLIISLIIMSPKKNITLTDIQKYELCLYARDNKKTRTQYVD